MDIAIFLAGVIGTWFDPIVFASSFLIGILSIKHSTRIILSGAATFAMASLMHQFIRNDPFRSQAYLIPWAFKTFIAVVTLVYIVYGFKIFFKKTHELKCDTSENLEEGNVPLLNPIKNSDTPSEVKEESNASEVPDYGVIPIISWEKAGKLSGIVENFKSGDTEEWVKCPVKHGPATYALRIHGTSMFNPSGSPSFGEKDIIFVDPSREFINKSLVIVRKNGDETATFKQLIIEGKSMYLQALNPNWPEKIIELSDDSVICGVVIAKLEMF